MIFYAELNEEKICTSISYTDSLFSENQIKIDSWDISILGKKWTGQGWEEVESPKTETNPTQLDRIEEAQLMMMEAIADQYEQGLEQDLINMEVQATIYETVMTLVGGEV